MRTYSHGKLLTKTSECANSNTTPFFLLQRLLNLNINENVKKSFQKKNKIKQERNVRRE